MTSNGDAGVGCNRKKCIFAVNVTISARSQKQAGLDLNAGHPEALDQRHDEVASNGSPHQATPGHGGKCQCMVWSGSFKFAHLSSWPWMQVDMKRQQESGHGMILYCPHHLGLVIKMCP